MRHLTLPGRTDPLFRASVLWLAVLGVFAALWITQDIAAPLVLALVFGVILAPVCDWLVARGLPRGPIALAVLIVMLSLFFVIGFVLEPLFWKAVEDLPRIKWELRKLLLEVRGFLQGIDDVTKGMDDVLGGNGNGADVAGAGARLPSIADALFLAPALFAQTIIFFGATFFFIIGRVEIYGKIARAVAGRDGAVDFLKRLERAERAVSRYFLAVTIINLSLGAALSLALLTLGVPAPLVWGALAALLNYIVYVGPAIVALGLFVMGMMTFSGIGAIVPMVTFLVINLIEAQFVTPSVVGRHVSVNPLLIFVSLVFWLWFWGPIGGVIAIPVLVVALALSNRFNPQTAG